MRRRARDYLDAVVLDVPARLRPLLPNLIKLTYHSQRLEYELKISEPSPLILASVTPLAFSSPSHSSRRAFRAAYLCQPSVPN